MINTLEYVKGLIGALDYHKNLWFAGKYKEAFNFWDLRVNHRVEEWFSLNKPHLTLLQTHGYGLIAHGCSTSGPKNTDYYEEVLGTTEEQVKEIKFNCYPSWWGN